MIPLKTATSISLKTPLTSCSSSFKKKGSFTGTPFLSFFWSLFLLQYFSLKLFSHGFSNSPPPSFSFFPLKNLCFFSSFLYLPPIHSIAPTIILWRCLEKKKKKVPISTTTMVRWWCSWSCVPCSSKHLKKPNPNSSKMLPFDKRKKKSPKQGSTNMPLFGRAHKWKACEHWNEMRVWIMNVTKWTLPKNKKEP